MLLQEISCSYLLVPMCGFDNLIIWMPMFKQISKLSVFCAFFAILLKTKV